MLLNYDPLPAVTEFLCRADAPMMIFTGDYRAGKTVAAAAVACNIALCRNGANMLVVGPDEQHIETAMKPTIRQLFNPALLRTGSDVWGLKNGTEIYFRSSDIDAKCGIPWDVIWHDCRIAGGSTWLSEQLCRLADRAGRFVWSTDDFGGVRIPGPADILFMRRTDNIHLPARFRQSIAALPEIEG